MFGVERCIEFNNNRFNINVTLIYNSLSQNVFGQPHSRLDHEILLPNYFSMDIFAIIELRVPTRSGGGGK